MFTIGKRFWETRIATLRQSLEDLKDAPERVRLGALEELELNELKLMQLERREAAEKK